MDRRKFLLNSCKSCAFISAGLILGSTLLDSCASMGLAVVKTQSANGKISLPLADFADKKIKLVRVEKYDFDIAVRLLDDGSCLALLLKCTHAGHPLTKTGAGFYCTLHGSRFAADGAVKTGPASKPLVHLATTVDDKNVTIVLI
jgi:Rieske Fe-S protein